MWLGLQEVIDDEEKFTGDIRQPWFASQITTLVEITSQQYIKCT
jgi:hypothetical protein